MKNIVVIVGSPRKNGNTELLADAFIEGARSAGNTVEKVSVIGKKIGLLAVCADEKESVFDSVITMYRSVLSYFSLVDGGMVTVYGVSEKGDIAGHPKLKVAEEMGRGI